MLNNSNAGGHAGHEPEGKKPQFSAEILENTLKILVKKVRAKKALEKNISIKKYIKKIVYSKEEIVISLFYKTSCEGVNTARPDSGRAGAAAVRPPKLKNKKSPWVTPGGSRVVGESFSPITIDIILPNTIHGSKNKGL